MSSSYDVIVVGGGVTGCAVAYELGKRSIKTLLLDKSLPGRATSASAGGLWPIGEAVGLGCGVIYHAAQAALGGSNGKHNDWPEPLTAIFRDYLVQSNALFPRLSDELKELCGVNIEYELGHGLLYLFYNQEEAAFVDRVAGSLPADAVLEKLSADHVLQMEPHLAGDVLGAARLSAEHQVNPMQLAEGFKRSAMNLGVTFRHDARVTRLRSRCDRMIGVDVCGEFVSCQTIVNAAGAWASRLAATVGLDLPVVPIRGQIVLTEALPPTLSASVSTSSCYLVQKAHGEILIGSTTDDVGFDVSVTEDAIQGLCRGAIRCIPSLRNTQVKRVWAGLRPGTPDELPILGPVSGVEGYINATGGFRTGIVQAPLTGEITAQQIAGEAVSYPLDPFLMQRFLACPD